jgi:hypothetical protein
MRKQAADGDRLDRAERTARGAQLGAMLDHGSANCRRPSSRSCMIAVAVNVLVIEPIR